MLTANPLNISDVEIDSIEMPVQSTAQHHMDQAVLLTNTIGPCGHTLWGC